MKRNRRIRNQRRSGFTLLEILVVVGIIALLAAMVVPSLIGTQERAEIKATMGNVSEICRIIDIFRTDMNRYPEELSELAEKPDDEEEAEKWAGPYLKSQDLSKLKDPWGKELQYKAPGDVNEDSYDLWSDGPDGEEGTDDDITNYKKED